MPVTPTPAAVTRPLVFDPALIKRLTRAGQRYSSYPTPEHFADTFGYRDYLKAVADLRTRGSTKPLSLYLHIPFCDSDCYYCACSKVVTKSREKASVYLSYLKREIEMQGRLFTGMNWIEQLHFGGGTANYLSDEQMEDLMLHLRRSFRFAADELGEYSIKVDPRSLTRERVLSLRRQGFNHISLSVQDYDPAVQKAVNRVQPEHETQAIIDAAREANFRSVSIELIYGLPKQTLESIAQTLAKVIKAVPDRIAVYNYAHRPHLFKSQRRINVAELPSADTRLAMLALCVDTLGEAGYVYIGMDHFARPGDDLAIAQVQGRLHRNFQGYSAHADMDLVACGISAIGSVAATYSQNVKTLDAYYDLLDRNELPIERGMCLNMDDALRRAIIQMLMCQFELSIPAIEQAYPISFAQYFAPELVKLAALEADGVVTLDAEWLSVTPRGRFLIGNVCTVFDRYLGGATIAPGRARTA